MYLVWRWLKERKMGIKEFQHCAALLLYSNNNMIHNHWTTQEPLST